MKVWLSFTLAAAVLQAMRTSLQHRLRALLSVSGAGFVRYVYGAPVSLSAVAVMALAGVHIPNPPARFWPIIAAAGVAQIFGTVFLIRAFDARNFAVGTVYSKTEVIQVALFSWVILGEAIKPLGWLAIGLCLVGVAVLASKGRDTAKLATAFRDRSAHLGIAAGGAFGLAAIGIRAASLSLGNSSGIVRALVCLAVMNTMQTVLHGGYLARREPDQIRKALVHWRSSAIVGLLSVAGSAGWAIAVTYGNVAQVRTVGQFELIVTFAIAHFWLHDRHSRAEYVASALVAVGVVTMLLGG
jgi:drug/metabolite transporter (DMT)-like permease